jgi:RHS repeat-associated protein
MIRSETGSAIWLGPGGLINSSNQLGSRSGDSCTYENNGNTLTSLVSAGTTTYSWDFENRFGSVTLPGTGGTLTFKYDPFGRRIYKSSSSAASIYAYDGVNLIEETNASGAVVARYTQGSTIDEPLAMLRSATTSYYHADGLGSVTSLSSSAGSLAQTYGYDSYGKQTSSSLTNPFQYTARELDSETGLYYYRARYYDPQSARFVSEDPLKFFGGDINLYRYVWNHPTSFRDPRGLWGAGVTGGAGAFGGVGETASGGATASIGGVFFSDPSAPLGFTSAGYLSLGAFGGDHGAFGTPGTCSSVGGNRGAGVGAGVGFIVTNANSVDDLAGPFDNTTVALPFIAIDLGEGSNGVKTLSVTAGPGWGLGIFHYTTNIYTNPVSPSSSQCGCSK